MAESRPKLGRFKKGDRLQKGIYAYKTNLALRLSYERFWRRRKLQTFRDAADQAADDDDDSFYNALIPDQATVVTRHFA